MMIDPGEIPVQQGAYALLIGLSARLPPTIPRLADRTLASGLYIYCGSAYGPGGLRGRIGRHLRRGKAVRWHVDHLTNAGDIQGIAVHAGGQECDLVAAFLARGAGVALAGFGSSDCRRCQAHLLTAPDGLGIFSRHAVVNLGPDFTAPL